MAVGHLHIFLTLTANPLEWTALHSPLPGYEDSIDQDHLKTLISEDPDIVVEFFVERRELFFKHVVNPKFDVVDSWGRFEFQKDGGIHWHGVLWCRNAPDPRSVSSDIDVSDLQAFGILTSLQTCQSPTQRSLIHRSPS